MKRKNSTGAPQPGSTAAEVRRAKVEDLHIAHPDIRAADWRSPLVRRLHDIDDYIDGVRTIDDSYVAKGEPATVAALELTWAGLREDFRRCLKTYQVHDITEYAALGLACILLTIRTGLEITEVTRRGEGADYWLGEKELMLEVSGQQAGNIDDLCSAKAAQMLSNPFQKDGYVCVATFTTGQARLWVYAQS